MTEGVCGRLLMNEKGGCWQNRKRLEVQKGWQNTRSWDTRREKGGFCRECSRLPEKKTRIKGETFEGRKKEGNRGNREVETAGRESTRERKGKGRIR